MMMMACGGPASQRQSGTGQLTGADTSPGKDPGQQLDLGFGGRGSSIDVSGSNRRPSKSDEAGDESPESYAAVDVRLVPEAGVTGITRVNFAVPTPSQLLYDVSEVSVWAGADELASARRALASYPDGSIRSVQIQTDVDVTRIAELEVRLGQKAAVPEIQPLPVEATLMLADGTKGPRVWALLPPEWLLGSGLFGPLLSETQESASGFLQWSHVCDYDQHGVDAFVQQIDDSDVWLYDRGATHYRGYARRGDLVPLRTAYLETAIYRARLKGAGAATRIGVPGKAEDLKYHYTQNLAIHYLLTGDERFRESAEAVALRVEALWPIPEYTGGVDFWTERHAAFALLAYVWASIVTDDRSDRFVQLADSAVQGYLKTQGGFPAGYADGEARCFAHHATAHGEVFGYFGCSPWMSAILADALQAYAIERDGAEAQAALDAIIKLGRIIERDGRDANGKPYYWMGVGSDRSEVDPGDQHWGEAAYVLAMAWHYGGRREEQLRSAALELMQNLETRGIAPHLRSFNWQCRSAVATPFYLQ